MALDPCTRFQTSLLSAGVQARHRPELESNRGLMILGTIFRQCGIDDGVLKKIDETIRICHTPTFNPMRAKTKGQAAVYQALQFLSLQPTQAELDLIKKAIPEIDKFRKAGKENSSDSIAEFSGTKATDAGRLLPVDELVKMRAAIYPSLGTVESGKVKFEDRNGVVKTIEIIAGGSIGLVFLIRDDNNNPIKILKTISAGTTYNERRPQQFAAYQGLTKPNATLKAGSIQEINDNGRIHLLESLDYSAAPRLDAFLAANAGETLEAYTAIARSMDEIHQQGVVATNLKAKNIVIEGSGKNLNARFINPSLFSHSSEFFKQYVAGSVPQRYYGDDFTAAINGDSKYQTQECAVKTDLWAFGVSLFQALCPKYLFESSSDPKRLSAKVNSDQLITDTEPMPAASAQLNSFLSLDDTKVASQFRDKEGNFVRNIYSWAASSKSSEEEIRARLKLALSGTYSEAKINMIGDLLVTLLTFKKVDGKYIMALDTKGTPPTAQWLYKQMTEIPT